MGRGTELAKNRKVVKSTNEFVMRQNEERRKEVLRGNNDRGKIGD
jgi:hypothetical protein